MKRSLEVGMNQTSPQRAAFCGWCTGKSRAAPFFKAPQNTASWKQRFSLCWPRTSRWTRWRSFSSLPSSQRPEVFLSSGA